MPAALKMKLWTGKGVGIGKGMVRWQSKEIVAGAGSGVCLGSWLGVAVAEVS